MFGVCERERESEHLTASAVDGFRLGETRLFGYAASLNCLDR